MCSCRRTRAPHLLLKASTGRFTVRLYRFTLAKGGGDDAESNHLLM